MTSLQKQLERLSVPFVQSALGQDTRRVSLLFDQKEAATLDREFIFQFGVSGLEELQNISSDFDKFDSFLFSRSNLGFERSMVTKEVNENLDKLIRQFLIRVSPYFLMKAAQKTLEWLIYRYHIHQFNVDDIMMAILPYHNTPMFVRALTLFKLDKSNSKWQWLQNTAKSGIPLPRDFLVVHSRRDPAFLGYICNVVPTYIEVFGPESPHVRLGVGLYSVVMLGMMENRSNITEKVLSIAIPMITNGLKTYNVDYKASSYLILSKLVIQVPLDAQKVTMLCNILSKHMETKLLKEAVCCLAIIVLHQHIKKLSKKSFRNLNKQVGFVQLLINLAKSMDLCSFLMAYLQCLIPSSICQAESGDVSMMTEDAMETEDISSTSDYLSQLICILENVNLSESVAHQSIRLVLDELIAKRQSVPTEIWSKTTSSLVSLFERRNQETLESVFEELQREDENCEVLREVVLLTSVPVRYEMIPDLSTNLFLGLMHNKASTRQAAIAHLGKVLTDGAQEELDSSVKEALFSRLHDDDRKVVLALLQLKQILLNVLDKTSLASALIDLVYRVIGQSKWRKVIDASVDLICSIDLDVSQKVRLLPLLVLSSDDVENNRCHVAVSILKSGLLTSSLFPTLPSNDLIRILEDLTPVAANKKLSIYVWNLNHSLAQQLLSHDDVQLGNSMGALLAPEWKSACYDFFLICLSACLASAMGKQTDEIVAGSQNEKQLLSVISYNLRLLARIVKNKTISKSKHGQAFAFRFKKAEQLVPCLDHLSSLDQFPAELITWSVYESINAVKRCQLPDNIWLDFNSPSVSMVVRIVEFCLSLQNSELNWRHLIAQLESELSGDTFCRIITAIFLRHFEQTVNNGNGGSVDDSMDTVNLPSDENKVSVGLLAASCESLKHLCEKKENVAFLQSGVLPCLVLMTMDAHEEVRQRSLECLGCLKTSFGDTKEFIHDRFLSRLLKRKEEIIADPSHAPQAVGVIFSNVEQKSLISDKSDPLLSSLNELLAILKSNVAPDHLKLQLLRLIACVPHKLVLTHVIDIGQKYLSEIEQSSLDLDILEMILQRFDENLAKQLTSNDPAWLFLMKTFIMVQPSLDETRSVQMLSVRQINRSFFHSLPTVELQQQIVTRLINTALGPAALPSQVLSCLKQVKLNGVHISHELKVSDGLMAVKNQGQKRQRLNRDAPPLNYKRLTVVLEAMQSRRKIADSANTAAILFSLLSRLVVEEAPEADYCRRLTLTCLFHICSGWTPANQPKSPDYLNIEALVQCLNSSVMVSPQTQQEALLVMTAIAPLYPEHLLHNIVSIFTFMGTSLLQKDDSYTFQIITKTVDVVIDSILQIQASPSNTKSDDVFRGIIIDILRVFVDARHHIPGHRCFPLFRQLVDKVGAAEHLWRLTVLVMESSVRLRGVPQIRAKDVDDEKPVSNVHDEDIDFIVNVYAQFPVDLQLESATKMITFLGQLLTLHNQEKKTRVEPGVFVIDTTTLSASQLRLLQYHTSRVVAAVLVKKELILEILHRADGKKIDADLEQIFQSLVKETICYMMEVTNNQGMKGEDGLSKFWQALLQKVYSILDKINYLLPTNSFLDVVQSLMGHESRRIQHKALDLLNNKLQQLETNKIKTEDMDCLLKLVTKLLGIVGEKHQSPDGDTSTIQSIQQMALYSIKLLSRLLGQHRPLVFTPVFPVVVSIIVSWSEYGIAVVDNALLCVAELCCTLKTHSIPFLQSFMPAILSIMQADEFLHSELSLVCILTALNKIIANLASFLSPYLVQLTLRLCNLSSANSEDELSATKKPQVVDRLTAVCRQLSTSVTARVFVPNASKSYSELMESNQQGLVPLFSMIQLHIESISKEDLTFQLKQLADFFNTTISLRNSADQLTWEELLSTERAMIDALLALVVRLSENSFRPIFYQLYDGSCEDPNCVLTFFSLSNALAGRLKTIFNLFAGRLVKLACKLLQDNNSANQKVTYFGKGKTARRKSSLLLENILSLLEKCFLYDDGSFSKNFEDNLQPLVKQLENFIGDEFEKRTMEFVIPCLCQLALSSKESGLPKELNYQICLQTRSSKAKVRFAALKTLEELARKLGQEYEPLLPDTAPFIAELLEDDSEEVEQQCQNLKSYLEEILGELNKYF